MPPEPEHHLADNLASNLKHLRGQRSITQAQLATRAEVPRSTLATLEVGDGNPTLSVLSRLSIALQVSIEELLSRPRAACELFPKGSLQAVTRGRGKATLLKLLPHPIPGVEFDRIDLAPGGKFVGVPHKPGTREYLCCEKGTITLWTGGDCFVLKAGDVAAFQGDQKHSYLNEAGARAVGFSVVVFVPPVLDTMRDP